MKNIAFTLNLLGALLGSLAACLYAVRVWLKYEHANPATWSIALVLNVVGLYLTYATGNHEPYIQIGWCVASTLIVTAAFVRKGSWRWTNIDAAVLTVCTVSVALWLTSEVVLVTLLSYLLAAFLSAFPQARDYLRNPNMARKSAWVWQVSIIAILLPLAAKYTEGKSGIEHTLIYWALISLNMVMSTLCMRRTA